MFDEFKFKFIVKYDGSKNFVICIWCIVISNIVCVGMECCKEVCGFGSVSFVFESVEEMVEIFVIDNDSDLGCSGLGSLVECDDVECSLFSLCISIGSWGVIGFDCFSFC